MARRNTKAKKEKSTEIFEVEKRGKEKVVQKEVSEDEKEPSKKQIGQENKILKGVLITLALLLILFVGGYFFVNNIKSFDYRGVHFETVSFCDAKPCLILYKTSLPVVYNGSKAEYNFYLRNDPRELEKEVPFTGGEPNIENNIVLNATSDFNCGGYGPVAVANMVNFYQLVGVHIFKNESLSCSNSGDYTFVNIRESNETSVEKVGKYCYNINVNDCEILKGTERFLIESFIKVNAYL